jgi:hypothetical protein
MLALFVAVQAYLLAHSREERGQTTAEYAVVLLGAAGVALLLLKWASKANLIGVLLDKVLDLVIGKLT